MSPEPLVVSMHIVYLIAPSGGPEAYVQTLLPYLKAQNHKVSIVYTHSHGGVRTPFDGKAPVYFARHGGLHYYLGRLVGEYRAWAKQLRIWESTRAIKRILQSIETQHPIDLVEVTEGVATQLIASQWPVLLRAHGSDWSFRHFCQDAPDRYDYLLQRMQAKSMANAQQVSSISIHLADHLSQACAFPRERIKPVPYPIDLNRFSPDGPQLDNDGPMLLTVGRLEHRKGTDVLVKALPLIWEKHPTLKAYFLGNEAQFTHAELRALVPARFRQQIVFPGFVPHQTLPQYYRAATIYVAPTQYETFGYTVLEAMACGKPVVSCPVGAVPELVEDSLNGCLVPFGNHRQLAETINVFLDNPDRCLAMGRGGRRIAEQYSVPRVGRQLEEIYQQARTKVI